MRRAGARVDAQANHAAHERRQKNAKLGQTEKQDEQLHQQRRATNDGHICRAKTIDCAALRVEATDAYEQAHHAAQQQGRRRDLHGHEGTCEQLRRSGPDRREIEFHGAVRLYAYLAALLLNHFFTIAA